MGLATYKGMIEWEDEFEGEISRNEYALVDTNPRALLHQLQSYLRANSVIINLEIKRVGSE